MNIRTLTVALVLGLLLLFAGLNWTAFTAPTQLNLLVTRVEAPLGLVMLGVVLVLTLLYVLFSLGVEASALLEVRRYARELYQVRKQLEDAEASRYAELKRYLEGAFARVDEAHAQHEKEVEARFEALFARLAELERAIGESGEATRAAFKEELERLVTQLETLKLQHREIVQKIEAVAERLRAELGEARS